MEGRVGSSQVAIAIGSFGMTPDQIAGLASDVGSSFTVVGRTALIIDLGGAASSTLHEIEASQVTVGEAVAHEQPLEILSERGELTESLFSVKSSDEPLDADEVASPGFRSAVRRMIESADVTFLLPGDGETALAQSIYQQADHVVLGISAGSVSIVEIEAFVADLRERGISILGVVLVGGNVATRRPIGQAAGVTRPARPAPGRSATLGADFAPSWVPAIEKMQEVRSRLTTQEIGLNTEDRRAAPSGSVSRPRLVQAPHDDLIADPEAGRFVGEFVETVNTYPADRVVGHVESFLEERLVGYLTTRSTNNGPTSRPEDSFAFFARIANLSSVADLVYDGLESELGSEPSNDLCDALERVIVESDVGKSIEDWLQYRFFRTHLVTSGGEPRIWHLASRHRHVQLLVDWHRFDRDTIDAIRTALNSSFISHLESVVPESEYVEAVADVRDFDAALGWLYEGTTPEARIWYPWLSTVEQPNGWDPDTRHGAKAHLAPIQRLGLLAVDVLKLNDLVSFSRSA